MKQNKSYDLQFQEIDVFKQKLSCWYCMPIHATSKYDAARQASKKLVRLEFVEDFLEAIPSSIPEQPGENNVLKSEKYHPVWNARIINPAKASAPYYIIVNGGFVINPMTGRKNKALAERLQEYMPITSQP